MNQEELTARIGDGLSVQAPEISRATLALFAGASGDHNPIHIDTDFAAAAGYDDVFAHGMLSVAYLAKALTGVVPQERLKALEVRFVSRTPVHAAPRSTITLREVDTEGDKPVALLDLEVVIASQITTITGSAEVRLDP